MNKQKREPLSFAAAVPRVIEVLSQNGHRHALIGGLAVGVFLAGRPQDIVDAARLVETCGAGLDRAYLEQWAQELGIEPELHRALE